MKKEQGSVTIMMCILFLAFVMLAGVLIDSARFLIAEVQVKRATQTAINSVLSEYDIELKEQYGLFAFEDNSAVNDKILKYMERSLNPTKNMRKGSLLSWIVKGDLSTYFSASNEQFTLPEDNFITEESPLMPDMYNLWDYSLPVNIYNGNSSKSLADADVFERQVLEYMKFRAPVQAVEGFLNKLGLVFQAKESTELAKERNKVEKELDKLDGSMSEIIKLIDGWYFDNKNKFQIKEGYFVKRLISSDIYYTDNRLKPEQIQQIFGELEDDTIISAKHSKDSLDLYYNSCTALFLLKVYKQYFIDEVDGFLPELKDMAINAINEEISDLEADIYDYENSIENNEKRISDLESKLSTMENNSDEYANILKQIEEEEESIDEKNDEIDDCEDKIEEYKRAKNNLPRCDVDEFIDEYMEYVTTSNIEDVSITYSEVAHVNECADYYNEVNNDISTEENEFKTKESNFSHHVNNVKNRITEYKNVCTDAKKKLEEFETQTEKARGMVHEYDEIAKTKKDNLLPGDYESSEIFVQQTETILSGGANELIEQSHKNSEQNGAITILENNITILDECLRILNKKDEFIAVGESLIDESKNTTLIGNHEEVISRYPNIQRVSIHNFNGFSSLLIPNINSESKVSECIRSAIEWESISSFLGEYRTDIKLNDSYKGFPIKDVPNSQPEPVENVEEANKNKEEAEVKVNAQKDNLLSEVENKSSAKKLTEVVISSLPSSQVSSESTDTFDIEPDKGIDMLDGGFNIFSGLENALLSARDALYFNEYIVNMFRTAMEGNLKSPRMNLRNIPIGYDENSMLDYEVEYILYGNHSDKQNYIASVASIFTIRTILNFIHLYIETDKKTVIFSIASSLAGWWTAGLGIPVFQAIISGIWSMAESVVDVKKLLSGEEVAFIKGKSDWYTWTSGAKEDLINKSIEIASESADKIVNKVTKHIDHGFENLIDSIDDKLGGLSEEQKSILREELKTIDDDLNRQLDLAESEIESAIHNTIESYLNSYDIEITCLDAYGTLGEEIKKEIETYLNKYGIEKGTGGFSYEQINTYVEDFISLDKIKNKKTAYIDDLINKAETKIDSYKEKLLDDIQSTLEEIKEDHEELIEDVKDKMVGALSTKLKEIGDSQQFRQSFQLNSNLTKVTSEKASYSFIRFSYIDYLRLFLVLTKKDSKIARTQDIIQINIMTNRENFTLSSAKTEMNIDSEAKINIIFLNLPFMPDKVKSIGENGELFKLEFVSHGSY